MAGLPKRGWSAVADVHLNSDNNRLLAGDPGQGALLSRGDSDLYTASDYGDVEVRLEFMVPRNSNSGVKLNGHYEIQIRDTHGKPIDQLTGDDCGGVYPRGTRAAVQVPRQGRPPPHQPSRVLRASGNPSKSSFGPHDSTPWARRSRTLALSALSLTAR